MTMGREWLDRIRALVLPHPVKVMNVCGGHERTVSQAGLRSLLPAGVEIIPGPGCPVCVCPDSAIRAAIRLSLTPGVILVTFGDMLRVPVQPPEGEAASLEEARGLGGAVVAVASPGEALRLAQSHPGQEVVFFAAGFETTMAPVAALFAQGAPGNLTLLSAGRLTWPAVAMLLDSGAPGFHALIAPGHVATVMGWREWEFIPRRHRLPVAVSGFTPALLLEALHAVLLQVAEARAELVNSYPLSVTREGNAQAKKVLSEVLSVVDAPWRGIGVLPGSGLEPAPAWREMDARARHPQAFSSVTAESMPKGCRCADVVLGKLYPDGCPLFATACRPRSPVGPCMVSHEGACRIWWDHGGDSREQGLKKRSPS